MSDQFQQETEGFHNWLKKNLEFLSDKFEIADLRSSNEGRALIATSDIEQDETIFEISRDKILNVETSQLATLNDGNNKQILLNLGQWECLILCLSYELMIGEQSKWSDYFKVMNKTFNTLVYWSDEELEYLKPSLVLDRIGKQQAEDMYKVLQGVITNDLKLAEFAKYLTLEKFHAVANLIMSYSFDADHAEQNEDDEEEDEDEEAEEEIESHHDHEQEAEEAEEVEEVEDVQNNDEEEEDEEEEQTGVRFDPYLKSMVPLADTLNSNTTLFNATLGYENKSLVMKATKKILKGEQIYNIYGEQPNSEILRRYGYVEVPNSKFEFAEIKLSNIKEFFIKNYTAISTPELFESVLEIISDSEYLEESLEDNEGGIVIDTYECYFDGDSIPELNLLVLILTTIYSSFEKDTKWFKKLYRTSKRKNNDFESFIKRAILKCYQLLEMKYLTKSSEENFKKIVQLRIDEYPSQLQDLKFTENDKVSTRKEMADVVLTSELQCLKESQAKNGGDYKIVEDEKLLKDVLKRKLDSETKRSTKRTRI
ncbi:methyltransferase activity protein [[Candida] boidinii]|nr:methyltransferase activity protein [[Candida] boidinii]OWB61736.1 methyltransferase activity protein [[Candida] boidinii]OWB70747.1 methyltransferase activity protein [[Candida] boidinii]OWB76143.1 methyltransferase activity protein [[Candida] boidinii]